MIKLSELKADRAAMTPGEYKFDHVNGTIDSNKGGPTQYIGKTICEMYISNMAPNAIGIVATHNAADVLIEIVDAALAFEQALREDYNMHALHKAKHAFVTALAKVTPSNRP